MATAGLLAKLSEIQEQQTTSSSHIQLLRDQHREWQRSVDELLADIRSQAEGVLVSAPVVQEAPEKQKDTDPASNEDNEDGNDEPNRASISFTRRSMSTESLLRLAPGAYNQFFFCLLLPSLKVAEHRCPELPGGATAQARHRGVER